MAPEDLRQKLRANPFRPFRLVMASGNSYLVPGPEWMLVTGLTTAVSVPGESEDGTRLILLDNMSITEAVPAEAATGR